MTSSTASTSPAVARGWLAATVVGVLIFSGVVAILAAYRFQPTIGTLFLALGWCSIVAFGVLAVKAVRAVTGDGAAIGGGASIDDRRRTELEREKRLLLKAIKEVEFDRDTNKIDASDAQVAVARYRERALEIIGLLDDRDRPITERIDLELKRRLGEEARKKLKAEKASAKAAPVKAEAEAEAEESKPADAPAKAAAGPATPTCAACGLTNDVDATFCKRCGAKVAA